MLTDEGICSNILSSLKQNHNKSEYVLSVHSACKGPGVSPHPYDNKQLLICANDHGKVFVADTVPCPEGFVFSASLKTCVQGQQVTIRGIIKLLSCPVLSDTICDIILYYIIRYMIQYDTMIWYMTWYMIRYDMIWYASLLTYLLTYLLTHSLIHSLTYLLTHSLTLTYLLTYLLHGAESFLRS